MTWRTNPKIWLVVSISLLGMVGTVGGDVIYVDADATGANDGTSWADAYKFLQDALADANSSGDVNEIRVAQGIYKPDQNSTDPNGSGDRTASFYLINSIELKGGYTGFGEPDPNLRDFELYETILSGDLDGNDVGYPPPDVPSWGENSYHVVTAYDVDETAYLDGFTITGGNANGNSGFSWTGYDGNDCGGGMLIHSSWPDGNCLPVIVNCLFEANVAANNGGGIYVYDGSPTIEHCTFRGNLAEDGGGGMNNSVFGSTIITNCLFINNEAGDSGGGVCNYLYSQAALTNCIFIGNVAGDKGSGMLNAGSGAIVTNCTFAKNHTSYEGVEALSQSAMSELWITNSILWDDTEAAGYYEIRNNGDIYVSYCDIQGGVEGGINNSSPPLSEVYDGGGNIDTDPCFANPDANDFHLKSQAGRWNPTTENCVIDAVTSPCIDAGDLSDPVGYEPFPNGGRVNIGAYGGTEQASKSYFGTAPCETIVAGDINGDCKVDFKDVAILAFHWLEDNNE